MGNGYPHSTIAQILEDIISQLSFEGESHSNIADILLSILNQTSYDKEPYSVLAELFLKLKAKIEGVPFDPYDKETHSVIADILISILNETEYTDVPQSRIAELLLELKEELESYTEITVSGSIVSFTTNVSKPLVKLKASVEAQQDLHGYDKPWAGGGGKNKCNAQIRASSLANGITSQVYADNRITASGQSSGNGDIGINLDTDLVLDSGKTYTISLTGTVTRTSALPVYLRVKGGSYTSPISMPVGSDYVNISNTNGTFDRILIRVTNTQTITMDAKIQVEEGNSPTSYAPYSNICPITGWSGANVTRTGKNLFDKTKGIAGKYLNGNGYEITSVSYNVTDYIEVKGGANITISGESTGGSAPCICYYDKNKTLLSTESHSGFSIPHTYTVPSNAYYFRESYEGASKDTFQIEYGNSASAYSSYVTGNTYTIAFGDTYYVGELDVTNGVLRVTHEIETLTSSDYWAWNSALQGFRKGYSGLPLSPTDRCNMCEILPVARNTTEVGIYYHDTYIDFIHLDQLGITDANSWKSVLNSTGGVTFTIPLATPFTIQLTPQQIEQLEENNIWADTGDVEVVYLYNGTPET